MKVQQNLPLTLCISILALASFDANAELQDIPAPTESQRASLLREKSLLELQIDVAKRKAELAKETAKLTANKSTEEQVGHISTQAEATQTPAKVARAKELKEKIYLVGVRGLNKNLTADLRVGGMPLTLRVGERYGDLKVKSLTPLCAKIVQSRSEKTICLSSLPQTDLSSPPSPSTSIISPITSGSYASAPNLGVAPGSYSSSESLPMLPSLPGTAGTDFPQSLSGGFQP